MAYPEIDLKLMHSDKLEFQREGCSVVCSRDVTGYYISEKLDGVRAYWNPELGTIYSRNGKPYHVPKWFID
jgi:ATP-dependent DNA ligase